MRVCWDQGIKRGLIYLLQATRTVCTIAPPASPFAPIPSNSASYLPLLKIKPMVSIVMPAYNPKWLDEAVKSVLTQSYENFELIIIDDCSSYPQALEALKKAGENDKVKLVRNEKNLGISGATNAGISKCSGDYIAFMDHDDVIHPDALATFARTLNDGNDADVYYTDEARMDEHGYVVAHMRKCPITMDLMLSCNAVLHFCIMKKEALAKVGPLNPEYDGAQDHDLMLRSLEMGLKFHHIPCILYSWRIHGSSKSEETRTGRKDEKDYPKTFLAGKHLIEAYLQRNNIKASVTDDVFPWYRVKYELPEDPGEVAIIVPFKDKIHHLKTLLESMKKTSYKKVVYYLVNNRSEEKETLDYLDVIKERTDIKIVNFDEPFNFSRLYNKVVRQVSNELLLFMNNDIEIIEPGWLEAMLEHIHRPGISAVGCRLHRADNSIQHAGMIFRPSIFQCATNLYYDLEQYTRVQRDVSGVTAACMLIRKSAFEAVGGFDEVHFPIGFSDADLCLKMTQKGHRIIYTPFAKLLHNESVSRKVQEESYEIYTLFRRYIGDTVMYDKHYMTVFSDQL